MQSQVLGATKAGHAVGVVVQVFDTGGIQLKAQLQAVQRSVAYSCNQAVLALAHFFNQQERLGSSGILQTDLVLAMGRHIDLKKLNL